MTKKLEEAFDLRPIKEALGEEEHSVVEVEEVTDPLENATRIVKSLSNAEKVDHALTIVRDLEEHDKEMDDIADEAMASYLELKELGQEQSDAHAARMMEVAANMLKTAMEAKANKANRKIKTLELQLKRLKMEQDAKKHKAPTPSATEDGYEFDRNELLRQLREQK